MSIPTCPLCGVTPKYVKNQYGLGVAEHWFHCSTAACEASWLKFKIAQTKEAAAAMWTEWANTITHPAWLGMDSAPKETGERVLLLYPSLSVEVASWFPDPLNTTAWLFDAAHRKPRRFQPIRWATLDPTKRQPNSHGAGVSND
ncbi:hypothetical protein [Stenotrophomonas acidaminiphila]|uniref:hypothetical protein n=1 Tax=Stenotrophomonas acidaminiphila TaxID=128780 RepID=UPI0028AF1DAC|nr:hypothetical protein [Stenotrophomonas acidaminiphila]